MEINRRQSYMWLTLASIFLSSMYLFNQTLVNRDGIYYLEGAALFNTLSYHELATHVDWPLFSILINLIANALHISYLNAARLLNLSCILLFCNIFCFLTQKLTTLRDNRLWIAALLIISFGSLNEGRSEILREPGGWCFLFLSLYAFVNYQISKRPSQLLLWFSSLLLATLFRFEFVVFAIIPPFIVIVGEWFIQKRWPSKAQLIPILFLGMVAIGLFLLDTNPKKHPALLRLDMLKTSASSIMNLWRLHSHNFSKILPLEARAYSSIILFNGLLGYFLLKVIRNITLSNWLIGLMAFDKKNIEQPIFISSKHQLAWFAYALTAIIPPVYACLSNMLLPSRLVTSFTLLALIPFSAWVALKIQNHSVKKKLFIVLCAFAILNATTHIRREKNYMFEAAQWIKSSEVDCLVSDNVQMAFLTNFKTYDTTKFIGIHLGNTTLETFTKEPKLETFLEQPNCKITLMALKFTSSGVLEKINGIIKSKPIQIYSNRRHKGYAIYRVYPNTLNR